MPGQRLVGQEPPGARRLDSSPGASTWTWARAGLAATATSALWCAGGWGPFFAAAAAERSLVAMALSRGGGGVSLSLSFSASAPPPPEPGERAPWLALADGVSCFSFSALSATSRLAQLAGPSPSEQQPSESPPRTAATASLSGVVRDAGGSPVEGANVTLDGAVMAVTGAGVTD